MNALTVPDTSTMTPALREWLLDATREEAAAAGWPTALVVRLYEALLAVPDGVLLDGVEGTGTDADDDLGLVALALDCFVGNF